jgi:hypothetical protein
MTTTPLPQVPVRSAGELTQRWAQLLDPPEFSARSLWMTWFDDEGRQLPVVVPIDELPLLPDRAMLTGLLRLHDTVSEQTDVGKGHLAMALCRPGRPVITAADDEWAEALRDELDGRFDGTWSLHLAADGRVFRLVDPTGWR